METSVNEIGSGGDNRKRINLLLAWNGDKEFAKARLRYLISWIIAIIFGILTNQ
jgi:hypothetical protein